MKRVDALRVSVTDRCNLRCVYCMPEEGVSRIPHPEILRFEEIERVARVAVKEGVWKLRLTGGEPLVRQGILKLVERLAKIEGVMDLPMTTNGVMLDKFALDLKRAGLTRVTVSMDTLRPDRFERITRRPWLDKVRRGIETAVGAGLLPVKVNVVMVPGQNDDEVIDFVEFARNGGVEVRFIERMPISVRSSEPGCGLSSSEYIPSAELRKIIEKNVGPLSLIDGKETGKPASVYEVEKGGGRLGFISAMSEPFCKWCARMRLTPDGKLRPCLASDLEIDVKGPMRSGQSDDRLRELFRKAVRMKPDQEAACFRPLNRSMYQIGG